MDLFSLLVLGILWVIGAVILVRIFVHVLYVVVCKNEKQWNNERRIAIAREIERGF